VKKMIDIFGIVSNIAKPLFKLIDDVHTSDEEKMTLKNEFSTIQNSLISKLLDFEKEKLKYEHRLLEMQGQVITAEAQGKSWIQRNWRPITMLTFLGLIICDSFGLLKFRLAAEAWGLLKIGLGGYVIGRSAEKIVPSITSVIKSTKDFDKEK
jgi:hypothetical protein